MNKYLTQLALKFFYRAEGWDNIEEIADYGGVYRDKASNTLDP